MLSWLEQTAVDFIAFFFLHSHLVQFISWAADNDNKHALSLADGRTRTRFVTCRPQDTCSGCSVKPAFKLCYCPIF